MVKNARMDGMQMDKVIRLVDQAEATDGIEIDGIEMCGIEMDRIVRMETEVRSTRMIPVMSGWRMMEMIKRMLVAANSRIIS